MPKILIVDDEQKIREVIREYSEFNGYEVEEAADGMEAVSLCRLNDYDLIIMDIMMPKLDGYSACKEIKKTKNIPVIMLSARGEEYDKLFGFELGIDDYVVKPFSPKELMARVNAVLARSSAKQEEQPEILKFDGLEINIPARTVSVDGKKVELTPKESRIMAVLASHPGEVYSKRDLIEEIWGEEYLDSAIAISVYIRRIRAKLEPDPSEPRYVQTVWHCGYRLTDEGGEERDEFEE